MTRFRGFETANEIAYLNSEIEAAVSAATGGVQLTDIRTLFFIHAHPQTPRQKIIDKINPHRPHLVIYSLKRLLRYNFIEVWQTAEARDRHWHSICYRVTQLAVDKMEQWAPALETAFEAEKYGKITT